MATENKDLILNRITYSLYKELEGKVLNTYVSSTTTELEAGFKLGVAHVLDTLRKQYVA